MDYERTIWDYAFDKKYAASDATELLPNHSKARGVLEKLLAYSQNPEHIDGRHKAVVFESAWGYNTNNARELERQIRHGLMRYRAENTGHNGYGERYQTALLIAGSKGKQPVQIGWIVIDGEIYPRMVTAYVDDKNRRP